MTPADKPYLPEPDWCGCYTEPTVRRLLAYERRKARAELITAPPSAPAAEPVPERAAMVEAARNAGFQFWKMADGKYQLKPIVVATAQAAPAAEPVQKCKVRDRGFVVVNGKHVPTVLVEFDIDDWDSRDRFAASVAAPAAESAEPKGGNHAE